MINSTSKDGFEEAIDTIDAMVFSSDTLMNTGDREAFKAMVERWQSEIKSLEKSDTAIAHHYRWSVKLKVAWVTIVSSMLLLGYLMNARIGHITEVSPIGESVAYEVAYLSLMTLSLIPFGLLISGFMLAWKRDCKLPTEKTPAWMKVDISKVDKQTCI